MTGITIHEDALPEVLAKQTILYIRSREWQFGAHSGGKSYPYWYRHFAGVFDQKGVPAKIKDCSGELEEKAPVIAAAWSFLHGDILKGHILTRCYANAYPYGCEGSVHRDVNVDDPRHYTTIFYPTTEWDMNWAGETMFFRMGPPPEILGSVWPRPNRLVVFPGMIPHVARGISRACPVLRMTLMFKTMKA